MHEQEYLMPPCPSLPTSQESSRPHPSFFLSDLSFHSVWCLHMAPKAEESRGRRRGGPRSSTGSVRGSTAATRQSRRRSLDPYGARSPAAEDQQPPNTPSTRQSTTHEEAEERVEPIASGSGTTGTEVPPSPTPHSPGTSSSPHDVCVYSRSLSEGDQRALTGGLLRRLFKLVILQQPAVGAEVGSGKVGVGRVRPL